MRKGIKFSLGVALAAAAGFAACPTVQAAELGGAVTTLHPAVALVMPFDSTENKVSYELVSRIGGNGEAILATHWVFWSESCDHLADVFICLTPQDTVVVDPTALQGELQSGTDQGKFGAVVNLTGKKGFVTVTSYEADTTSQTCAALDPTVPSDTPALIGSFTVANLISNASFGNSAFGIVNPADSFPVAEDFFLDSAGGLFIQSFDPTVLTDSEVFFIGLAYPNGNGRFKESEVGPIPDTLSDGSAVCCSAEYIDIFESAVSLPDICLTCATTLKIADNAELAGVDLGAIIPDSIPIDLAGYVRVHTCVVGSDDGTVSIGAGITIDGVDRDTFLIAWHGMAVGPFGAGVMGRYTAE